ncbi:hypothetical protein PYCC9005_003487 [Savitreella phatthalungensis]
MVMKPEEFHWEEFTLPDGRVYRYIDESPKRRPLDTLLLLHGWPDSYYGYRYQIPFLRDLGFRVLCPSMIGYGAGTTSPDTPLELYAMKSVCADMVALLDHVGVRKVGLLSHDWSGVVCYNMCLRHPKRVGYAAVIATAFQAPARGKFIPLDKLVEKVPQFAYQLWLASDEPRKTLKTKDDWRKFFKYLFQPGKGMRTTFDNLAASPDSPKEKPLLSEEEIEVYVEQYYNQGPQASTNWYRTRQLNYEDETRDFPKDKDLKIECPVLFIATMLDPVLKPEMSLGMEKYIPKLSRAEIQTGHWGQVEAKDEVNTLLKEFYMRQALEKMRHSI